MNIEHYWAVAEQDIEIQNPVTDRKLRLLDDYCDVSDGLSVLDVGCGKAWLMRYWADKFTILGTGLDINSRFLNFARARRPVRGVLGFIDGPALNYAPASGSFDIAMCIGATAALGGFVEAVDWIVPAIKPGGLLVVGDLTLKHKPSHIDELLPHDALDSIEIIGRHGAEVSALISASDADFERYVSHHRHSALRWALDNPTHPERDAVLAKSKADWQHYLRVVRPYLGFTIFVCRKTAE